MKAEILSVGTEILLGDIVNTNAHYLSKELALLGISVYRQTTVGDNEDRLLDAIRSALKDCDIIFATGGLGPTTDDITKEIAAKAMGKDLYIHEPSLERIKGYFRDSARAMTAGNEKQALFPKDAYILENDNGTAPGCIMTNEKGQSIVVLPGPPKEMIPMFEDKVKPYLEKYLDSTIISKSLKVIGLGEWDMASRVRDIITGNDNPTVAPYAKDFESLLRITAKAETESACRALIDPVVAEIKARIGEYIYGEDDDTIEKVVGELLIRNNLKFACAESVTGGMIASRMLGYEGGMSKVFDEAFVTYSNESKTRYLGVDEVILKRHGAVSEETCHAMAKGLLENTGAEVGLVTTGIAGPEGGSPEKPVGLVYIGVNIKGTITVFRHVFSGGDRNRIRSRATVSALGHLRTELAKELNRS